MLARPILLAAGDPFAHGLGGTEQAVIHLADALAANGHRVTVANGAVAGRMLGAVTWQAPGELPARADVTVAINDATLLPPSPGLPVVWFHNEVEFLRELRKFRLPALRHHRPAAVFIGTEQARLASRLLPFRARATIPYGLPDRVLSAEPAATPPGPSAIFTSQAYRGLDRVIALWRTHVTPNNPRARLTAYIAPGDLAAYGVLAAGTPSITVRGRIGNDQVLETLRGSRVLLAPGHRSETFCLAAAEAIAMGVPTVTLGIGSLKERVANGRTGFICRNWRGMAARICEILGDDALWTKLHTAGLATRHGNGWARAAADWENFVEAARQ